MEVGGRRSPWVRPAVQADEPIILRVLEEASRWSFERSGLELWPFPLPADRVRPAVEAGEVFVAGFGDDIEGTLTLQWEDPLIWGPRDDDAGYVHKLAARRGGSARGIGAYLLAWAEDRVRERQRGWVRLDTRSDHAALRRYYENRGFRPVGLAFAHGLELVLLEKPVLGESAVPGSIVGPRRAGVPDRLGPD